MFQSQTNLSKSEIQEILTKATKKIAPLWSLENFVAVNPYMGLANMEFGNAMDFLVKTGEVQPTLPISFYLDALKQGKLNREDISKALADNDYGLGKDADYFISGIIDGVEEGEKYKIKTMTDVASEINGKKWKRFMVDRISFWASAYFDDKQAIWNTSNRTNSVYQAWKREAEVDFSPEAMGLKGFRKFVKSLPNDYLEATNMALDTLEISESSREQYLNSLLMKMNGWVGFAARIDWDAGLAGQESHKVDEFLTIMLMWELAFRMLLKYDGLASQWLEAKQNNEALVAGNGFDRKLSQMLVLQQAFDKANQRQLIQKLNFAQPAKKEKSTPKAQAIFCIDVRSELYRRNLEAVDDEIETLGFAGFFAFPIEYVPVGHKHGTNQCPVLLTTSHSVPEKIGDMAMEDKAFARREVREQVLKAWKSFKQGAITCFSFVSPLGIYFLPKLITDSFGLTRPMPHPDESGLTKKEVAQKGVHLTSDFGGIPMEDRIKMATGALNAMSLTENFARTVLIVGHGSSTVNNPHGTGLDCGACGGHTGEANAKVAAAVLNDPEVRKNLKASGIDVPDTTVFVPALHDTTTDNVSLFLNQGIPESHLKDIEEIQYSLDMAGESARLERAQRMNIKGGDIGSKVIHRSKDWSQVRPEWGLAGCSSFVVAPRERTAHLNFGGKTFMHNYSWKKDKGFGVLELIMTAPMVVTSWINLQYYASSVDNKKFGAGNKALHNVVGGLGVLEGFAGDLRTGLAWQSVHDGENFQHEPQRLNVFIEAPVDEMSKILEKHESVRNLCDNEWIYLFAMNEEGKVAYKYIGDLEWEVV